jgi:hypothetical protein
MTETIRRLWYPQMPPALPDESSEAYTNRLTGADQTDRVPYDHRRNRQCSIGWHGECSDPEGVSCECPCHFTEAPAQRHDDPRVFALVRTADVSGVSGTGVVARGVQFADGTTVIRWESDHASTVVWDSLADAMAVHGHDGATTAVWIGETDG